MGAYRGLVAGLLICMLCAACFLLMAGPARAGEDTPLENPLAGDPGAVARGRELYGRYCYVCHLESGGSGPDLTDGEWKYGGSDAEVFRSIARGRGTMPAMSAYLGRVDIWSVIAYLRSLAQERKAAPQGRMPY